MAWCPRCGNYYIIPTETVPYRRVTGTVVGRTSSGLQDVVDELCPDCVTPRDTAEAMDVG